jgi:hypothetical protein
MGDMADDAHDREEERWLSRQMMIDRGCKPCPSCRGGEHITAEECPTCLDNFWIGPDGKPASE